MRGFRSTGTIRSGKCIPLAGAVFVAILLAGCVQMVRSPSSLPDGEEGQQVAQYFELRGRISVRVGDRIDAGQIRWTRDMQLEEMGFFSPLGTQVAQVSQAGAGPARMRRGEEVVEAATLNELASQMLGFPVGPDRIAAWVQGAGLREGVEIEVSAGAGDPWRVLAEGLQVTAPYRHVRRVTAIRGDMVVKLIVDEWRAR